MNIEAIVLGLLAIFDLGLLVELRTRRGRRIQQQRIERSLQLAMQRGSTWNEPSPQRGLIKRAS